MTTNWQQIAEHWHQEAMLYKKYANDYRQLAGKATVLAENAEKEVIKLSKLLQHLLTPSMN